MTTYLITPDPDGHGYQVQLIGADGVRQPLLYFPTESEAEEWVAAERKRDTTWGGARN